jgi:CHAD domain-containing protein
MPYRFQSIDQTVTGGVRRIALEQIDGALSSLEQIEDDPAEAIHDMRKRCKKLRSLIRLVRPAFPAYAGENAAIRDAAGRFSAARDTTAMLQAYDGLCDAMADRLNRSDVAAIRRRLTADRKRAHADPTLGEQIAACRAALENARARIPGWSLTEEGFDAVEGGLRKSYKRARNAMQAARRSPTDASMHEWRKRVKHHRQHIRLLRDLWRRPLGAREQEADRLGDLLGDHHDLAVLYDRVAAEREAISEGADVDRFLALARERQAALSSAAFTMGARLFGEKPKALTGRLRCYWLAWTADLQARDADAA